jgi:hypothetical protein
MGGWGERAEEKKKKRAIEHTHTHWQTHRNINMKKHAPHLAKEKHQGSVLPLFICPHPSVLLNRAFVSTAFTYFARHAHTRSLTNVSSHFFSMPLSLASVPELMVPECRTFFFLIKKLYSSLFLPSSAQHCLVATISD